MVRARYTHTHLLPFPGVVVVAPVNYLVWDHPLIPTTTTTPHHHHALDDGHAAHPAHGLD